MPISFTPADVIRLAPDASSAKNGQALADARKWQSFGSDDGVLWGECQGSGKNPYHSQIDLGETAFKCSCPSRKFPCKHGLGLLLLYANAPATVPRCERPAWVSEWLSSRQARSEKKAATAKETKPVDTEAQAERREQRLTCIREGMAELHSWVLDWMKSGIASAPAKGWDFWFFRILDAMPPAPSDRWMFHSENLMISIREIIVSFGRTRLCNLTKHAEPSPAGKRSRPGRTSIV